MKADEAMYYSKRHGSNNTVLASKIKFLKIRRVFFVISAIILITLASIILYNFASNKGIQISINKIKNIKIITRPKNLDKVILKTGGAFEGRIISETDDKLVLNLYFGKEEGTITLNKSEISQIKYHSSK